MSIGMIGIRVILTSSGGALAHLVLVLVFVVVMGVDGYAGNSGLI